MAVAVVLGPNQPTASGSGEMNEVNPKPAFLPRARMSNSKTTAPAACDIAAVITATAASCGVYSGGAGAPNQPAANGSGATAEVKSKPAPRSCVGKAKSQTTAPAASTASTVAHAGAGTAPRKRKATSFPSASPPLPKAIKLEKDQGRGGTDGKGGCNVGGGNGEGKTSRWKRRTREKDLEGQEDWEDGT